MAAPPPAPVVTIPKHVEFDRIEFNGGSSTLTPESRDVIGRIAATLKAQPDTHVQIAGYTDNSGSEPANVALSRSRANVVKDTLQSMGVATDRMKVEAYGSQDPIASNATKEGRAENRRVSVQTTEP